MSFLNSLKYSLNLSKYAVGRTKSSIQQISIRNSSFYNIDDNLFGLSDEQQHVRYIYLIFHNLELFSYA